MQNPLIQDASDFERECKLLLTQHSPDSSEDDKEDLRRAVFSSFIQTLGRTDAHKGKFDELVTDATEYVDVEGVTLEATPHRITISLPADYEVDPVIIKPDMLDQFDD